MCAHKIATDMLQLLPSVADTGLDKLYDFYSKFPTKCLPFGLRHNTDSDSFMHNVKQAERMIEASGAV